MTDNSKAVAFAPPRLPWHPRIEESFGISKAAWPALIDAVHPAAQSVDTVVLALSYCKARGLDPFKRVVHIVPVWNSNLNRYVDTIWPGIGELRTTAFRTGKYAGCDSTEFGPDVTNTFKGRVKAGKEWSDVEVKVTHPSWARITVYRMIEGQRVSFPGPTCHWLASYGRRGKSDVPNEKWAQMPHYMLEKVAEAAALRKAFPEEIGDQHTDDEMAGQAVDWPGHTIEGQATEPPPRPTRQMTAQEHAQQKVSGEHLKAAAQAIKDSLDQQEQQAEADLDAEYVATVGPAEEAVPAYEMPDDEAQAMAEQILHEIGEPDTIKALEYKTARSYVVNGLASLRRAGKDQKVEAVVEYIQEQKERLAKAKGRE